MAGPEKKRKKDLRLFLKGAIGVAAFVLLAIAGLVIFSQTRPFKNWLRDYIVDTANENLKGQLSIARLDGNLFSSIEFQDVDLTLDRDTLASVYKIGIEYDLFDLIGGVIRINSIDIDSLRVKLEQSDDSSWSILGILPASDDADQDSVESSVAFEYIVRLEKFNLSHSWVSIEDENESTPSTIDDINLTLSALYSHEEKTVNLESLSMRLENPDLIIDSAGLALAIYDDSLSFGGVEIKTAVNSLRAEALIVPDSLPKSSVEVAARNLDLSEFSSLMPEIALKTWPSINMNIIVDNDEIQTDLTADLADQKIEVNLWAGPVHALMDSSSFNELKYTVQATLDNVALDEWSGYNNLDVDLNGSMSLKGRGVNPDQASVELAAKFERFTFSDYPPSQLNLNAQYEDGDITGGLKADGVYGRLEIDGALNDLMNRQSYDINLLARKIDLTPIMTDSSLKSDINIELHAKGYGFDPNSSRGKAEIDIRPSHIKKTSLDSAFISMSYENGQYIMDTLWLLVPGSKLQATGEYSASEKFFLNYALISENIEYFRNFMEADSLEGQGSIRGNLEGEFDDMSGSASIDWSDLVYDGIEVGKLQGELEPSYEDSIFSGSGHLKASHISYQGLQFDSLNVSLDYTPKGSDIALNLYQADGVKVTTDSRLTIDSVITVMVRKLGLDYNNIHWLNSSDSIKFTMSDDRYRIDNLEMESSSAVNDDSQSIRVDGEVDFSGRLDLMAELKNIRMQPLGELMKLDLDGRLDSRAEISGPADNPQVSGSIEITDGRYQRFAFNELRGSINYTDRLADFDLLLQPTVSDDLKISGKIPLKFSLADTPGPESTDSLFEIKIRTDSLSLDILKAAGYQVEEAEGYISCDLSVTNTIDDPTVNGNLRLWRGRVHVPEYGIKYDNIFGSISFLPHRIDVDSLVARRDKGKLMLSGYLQFDSSLMTGNFGSSEMEMVTKNFYALKHNDYEVQVTSDIKLEGDDQALKYGGRITVNRSRIFLPAFMGDTGPDPLDEASKPMLVKATTPDTYLTPSRDEADKKSAESNEAESKELIEKLKGRLTINIPRNTWIKSPDLNMELAGDITVVKDAADFELFGEVRVVRGHYDLYGKRFTVRRGVVAFEGGTDYNPRLDIMAEYVFRTATREKKKIVLEITGKARQPQVAFFLDNTALSEGDALSYIVFGRPLDELSQGQRSSVSENTGVEGVAKNVGASLLSGQLTKVLGNKLNMDVIEVKAQNDWQGAAIVLGKYLTPDLFMSYQRSFGSDQDNDPEPEIVTLEYQLTRLLFLQLTEGDAEEAGFDIILKLEK